MEPEELADAYRDRNYTVVDARYAPKSQVIIIVFDQDEYPRAYKALGNVAHENGFVVMTFQHESLFRDPDGTIPVWFAEYEIETVEEEVTKTVERQRITTH